MKFLRFLWGWWGAPSHTVLILTNANVYTIAAESRFYILRPELRSLDVLAESRTWVICRE